MAEFSKVPGLQRLLKRSDGDPSICVAVLDGPVDLGHPCFAGAHLTVLPVLGGQEAVIGGPMSVHGTHVASIIFGQKESPVEGLVPKCRGVIVPIFSDHKAKVSQLDLTRGIELAVEAGAHLINISGGQLIEDAEDEADEWLRRAVELCRERDVLIVAAAGNDRCACLHLPAALPSVLAVGAMDDDGYPMEFSNWGAGYGRQGVLAPGYDVHGAMPGGGTARLTGSSFAAPIVTGMAALLLSVQLAEGKTPSPREVREALLAGVRPCKLRTGQAPGRCLAGRLDVTQTLRSISTRIPMSSQQNLDGTTASCSCQYTTATPEPSDNGAVADTHPVLDRFGAPERAEASASPSELESAGARVTARPGAPGQVSRRQGRYAGLVPSGPTEGIVPSNDVGIVYALGTLGFDFGTEARRDTFKQLMPMATFGGVNVPANPYDSRQIVDYLKENPSEAKALIWTLNLELTPIYAIEPVGSFGNHVYDVLRELLVGEIEPENSKNFVDRVSVPGLLSGRTARLFSGQVVPVIEIGNVRGLFGWHTNVLISTAIDAVKEEKGVDGGSVNESRARRMLEGFLNRVYYDMRNLGVTSRDRALNFAVTNAFQLALIFLEPLTDGMDLDSITIEKSPICRLDSDCWDVKMKFFDPENNRRAKLVRRFTIDVSDTIPVTLGQPRKWTEAY